MSLQRIALFQLIFLVHQATIVTGFHFPLLSLIEGAFPGCTNYAWGNGSKYCVDPCTIEDVVYSSIQVPVCNTYGKGQICPHESIQYNIKHNPQCILHKDGQPCDPKYIMYYKWQNPGCYDGESVAYYDNSPVCLQCSYDKIKYSSSGYLY